MKLLRESDTIDTVERIVKLEDYSITQKKENTKSYELKTEENLNQTLEKVQKRRNRFKKV